MAFNREFIPVLIVAAVALAVVFQFMGFPDFSSDIAGEGKGPVKKKPVITPDPSFGGPVDDDKGIQAVIDYAQPMNLAKKYGTSLKYVCEDFSYAYYGQPPSGTFTLTNPSKVAVTPTSGSLDNNKLYPASWDANYDILKNKQHSFELSVSAGGFSSKIAPPITSPPINWSDEIEQDICGSYAPLFMVYDPPKKVTRLVKVVEKPNPIPYMPPITVTITVDVTSDVEAKFYTLQENVKRVNLCGKKAVRAENYLYTPGNQQDFEDAAEQQIMDQAMKCLKDKGYQGSQIQALRSEISRVAAEISESSREKWLGLTNDNLYFISKACPSLSKQKMYDISIQYYKYPLPFVGKPTEEISGQGVVENGKPILIKDVPEELVACILDPPLDPNDSDYKELEKTLREGNQKHDSFSLCCDDK